MGAGSFADRPRVILVLQGVDIVVKISCLAAVRLIIATVAAAAIILLLTLLLVQFLRVPQAGLRTIEILLTLRKASARQRTAWCQLQRMRGQNIATAAACLQIFVEISVI